MWLGTFFGTTVTILVAVGLGQVLLCVYNYEKCGRSTYVCSSIATSYLLYLTMEAFCKYMELSRRVDLTERWKISHQ